MASEDEFVGPDVASAGLHVSECIGKDVAGQLDLEESLEASRYSSHPYSSHPKEWPPLAEVVETQELPPVLIERYNVSGGEGTALCGIFPEIRRAWASVDNSLFLWRFDIWEGQCPEYSGEEQAICAVGFARSKPGIFVEAIQYLLVLATPVEPIALLTPVASLLGPIPSGQTKYLDLLAKYYVLKRQHFLAANILYRLAERQCSDVRKAPTLEQRHQYLSNAVLQAKSANSSGSPIGSAKKKTVDDQLLDVLEAKLAVLRFQMRIKEELELMASKLEDEQGIAESHVSDQIRPKSWHLICRALLNYTMNMLFHLSSGR